MHLSFYQDSIIHIIITMKWRDNMILVFSIFLSPHRHSYPSIFLAISPLQCYNT